MSDNVKGFQVREDRYLRLSFLLQGKALVMPPGLGQEKPDARGPANYARTRHRSPTSRPRQCAASCGKQQRQATDCTRRAVQCSACGHVLLLFPRLICGGQCEQQSAQISAGSVLKQDVLRISCHVNVRRRSPNVTQEVSHCSASILSYCKAQRSPSSEPVLGQPKLKPGLWAAASHNERFAASARPPCRRVLAV